MALKIPGDFCVYVCVCETGFDPLHIVLSEIGDTGLYDIGTILHDNLLQSSTDFNHGTASKSE